MPSLTLQTAGAGGARSSGGADPEPSSSDPSPGQDRAERRQETGETGRATRGRGGPVASGRRDPGGQTASPPAGRDASALYPDLTVKTLAPRIDATQREESRQDVTRRGPERGRERGGREQDLDELLSGGGIDASPSSPQVDRLVEKLHREIERKMRIERERRGL